LRDAWMARSFPTGTAVSVTREGGTIAGLYRGLAGNGGMLLEVEGRVETIIHGDIALGS
jgi:biotin-(acetyl-CoA carboxylase) ligase